MRYFWSLFFGGGGLFWLLLDCVCVKSYDNFNKCFCKLMNCYIIQEIIS